MGKNKLDLINFRKFSICLERKLQKIVSLM